MAPRGRLPRAHALAAKNERVEIQRALAMADAELALARGRTRQARESLARLGVRLAQAGMALADLDRRLLLLRVDAAERQPSVADTAAKLAADAQARQAGLIVQRVRAVAR